MKSKDEGEVKLRPYGEADHPDKAMHFPKMKDKFRQMKGGLGLNCVRNYLNSGSSGTKPS